MSVPSCECDSYYPFVWCVWAFDLPFDNRLSVLNFFSRVLGFFFGFFSTVEIKFWSKPKRIFSNSLFHYITYDSYFKDIFSCNYKRSQLN